jgi:hypothetical protein
MKLAVFLTDGWTATVNLTAAEDAFYNFVVRVCLLFILFVMFDDFSQ